MLFNNIPWWRRRRSTESVLAWLKERLGPVDENAISFLQFGDDRALEEFSKFCHEMVVDRDASFTEEDRRRLYKRWLASGQRCLMSVRGKSHRLIGATVVLPLPQGLYEKFCEGGLDALHIETFDIERNPSCDHRYLLIDIMAFDGTKPEVLEGMAYRSLVRHISELYNPNTQGGLTLIGGTGAKGLAGRLKDLGLDVPAREAGADSFVYRWQVTHLIGAPLDVKEFSRLLHDKIKSHHAAK